MSINVLESNLRMDQQEVYSKGNTGRGGITYPLLNPRGSIMIFASTTGPARSNSFFKSSARTSKNKLPTYTVLLSWGLWRSSPALSVLDSDGAELDGNPAAAPKLCAAPTTDSLAVSAAWATDSVAEDVVSLAF